MIGEIADERLPVEAACRVLGALVWGDDDWRQRAPSARAIRPAWVTRLITEIHEASRRTPDGDQGVKPVTRGLERPDVRSW